MKLSSSIVWLILLPLGSAFGAPLPLPKTTDLLYPSRIRVRLAESIPKVQVRGFDLKIFESRRATSGDSQRRLASSPDRLSEWELRCHGGKVRAMPLKGNHGQPLLLQEPITIQSPAGFIQFRDRPYREELQIHAVGSFCEVVNHVEVEKYLDGLVNSEFNSHWSEEAIGAQVVAARTYALYQIMLARGETDRHYDVDATVRDQVYDGSMKEDFRASRSVERTRGLVLTSSAGKPMKAFYHSTCGGMTELPEHVWGNSFAGFKHAVRCPYCSGSPAMNWQLELSVVEVAQAFSQVLLAPATHPAPSKGWPRDWREALKQRRLVELRAGRWDAEGRVSEVITEWAYLRPSDGRLATVELRVSGARFREWIGPARFRSAAFQVIGHRSGSQGLQSWHFQGRGNGHGVGMCQWGAKTMGERGFNTASILKHYYPDAVLGKLW